MTAHPVDAIGIVVTDLPTSLAFYRACGFDVPEGTEGEDHVDIPLGPGLRLMLDTAELAQSLDPGWTPPTGSRVGLAVNCGTPTEVDALYAAIVAAGFDGHAGPFDAVWGQRYATVRDPDGVHVDLYAPLD